MGICRSLRQTDALVTYELNQSLQQGSFNFGWRYGDTVSFFEYVFARHWLTIDTNQKVVRLAALHLVFEELLNSCPFGDIDVICKAPAEVIYVE